MRYIKTLGAMLLALLITLTLVVPASAATVTEDLFYLSEKTNMAIRIDYDTQAPSVSFMAPDETVYDDVAISEGRMFKQDDGSSLCYQIPGAAAGQWKIVYDKGSNKNLTFRWAPYGEGISVEHFSYEQDDSALKTSFRVKYVDDSRYSYTISAVVLDENGEVLGSKELETSSTYANHDVNCNVYLRELNSYSNYYLMLHVTMEQGDIQVFDTQVSDKSFSYTNPNVPTDMTDVRVEVGVTDQYLRVQWDPAGSYSRKGYLLSVYEDDQTEPSYYTELEADICAHEVTMAHTASKYRVEVRYKNGNGVYSEPVSKTVDLSMKDLLSIPTMDVTNGVQVPVSFDFSRFNDAVKAVVSVNGTQEELVLKGKSSVSVNLDENQNKFAVTWWAEEGVSFRISATIYSDRTTPVLRLYEFASGTATTDKASYILTGSTIAGCTVTVGDKTAEVDSTGVFRITLPLQVGTNQFAVVATSPSGNSAQQTIEIKRNAAVIQTEETGTLGMLIQWLPLALSVLFSLLLCGHILLSRRMIRKRKGTCFGAIKAVVSNSFIFLALMALAGVAWTLIYYIQANNAVNSEEFYHTAEASIPEAYAMLETVKRWKMGLIITGVCFGGFILLAVGVRLIPSDLFVRMKAKRQENKERKQAASAPVAEAPAPMAEAPKPANICYCSHCGAENDANTAFCITCGEKLVKQTEDSQKTDPEETE